MPQSNNFGFGEDEAMLRDAARKFFTDNCPPDRIHAQVAHDYNVDRPIECIWDKDLWRQITELGWTAACVPEDAGGIGLPVVAAAALAEEAGKVAFPSPLIATLCSTMVLRECASTAATAALADVAAGQAVSLAMTNRAGSWEPNDTDVEAVDGKLTGTAWFVQDAGKADSLVVEAHGPSGAGLYLVSTNAAEVNVVPDGIVDLTRDQAHVEFVGAPATELAAPGSGAEIIDRAMPAILSIVSAEMAGAGEWLLQTTVEYAKTRTQFDRPLGFFQAIKHPLVNVMIEIDRAKSLAYAAACAVDEEPDDAWQLARMAKAAASDMAAFSANRAVQFHGGIGFTWECYVHIFFKRQMHNQVLYGDAVYHRAKLAEMLMGRAA
jgi:alkylation response protein AidB-like acyl-CoA dehydrogenase